MSIHGRLKDNGIRNGRPSPKGWELLARLDAGTLGPYDELTRSQQVRMYRMSQHGHLVWDTATHEYRRAS